METLVAFLEQQPLLSLFLVIGFAAAAMLKRFCAPAGWPAAAQTAGGR